MTEYQFWKAIYFESMSCPPKKLSKCVQIIGKWDIGDPIMGANRSRIRSFGPRALFTMYFLTEVDMYHNESDEMRKIHHRSFLELLVFKNQTESSSH